MSGLCGSPVVITLTLYCYGSLIQEHAKHEIRRVIETPPLPFNSHNTRSVNALCANHHVRLYTRRKQYEQGMRIVDIARQPGVRYSPYLMARIFVEVLETGTCEVLNPTNAFMSILFVVLATAEGSCVDAYQRMYSTELWSEGIPKNTVMPYVTVHHSTWYSQT